MLLGCYWFLTNGLTIQFFKEINIPSGGTWINLYVAMQSYIIVDGRHGDNLHDVTAWSIKERTRFFVNPDDNHNTDFLIIGFSA